MTVIDSTLTPEDREELIIHAIQKTYFLNKSMARSVLSAHMANEMRSIDNQIGHMRNPHSRGRRAKAWAEAVGAIRDSLFWREMRLRASAERAMNNRWRKDVQAAQEEPTPRQEYPQVPAQRPGQAWPTDQSLGD